MELVARRYDLLRRPICLLFTAYAFFLSFLSCCLHRCEDWLRHPSAEIVGDQLLEWPIGDDVLQLVGDVRPYLPAANHHVVNTTSENGNKAYSGIAPLPPRRHLSSLAGRILPSDEFLPLG